MPSGFGGQSQQRWGDNTLNQNEYMRDVQMVDTTGRVCATGDVRRKGSMILLAFFRRESPETSPLLGALQRLSDAYRESGKLTVWGVSPDDAETTAAFATSCGVKFPVLLDRDGYHAMTYGLTTFPTVYLADAGGTVKRKTAGFRKSALGDISSIVATTAGVDAVDLFSARIEPGAAAV